MLTRARISHSNTRKDAHNTRKLEHLFGQRILHCISHRPPLLARVRRLSCKSQNGPSDLYQFTALFALRELAGNGELTKDTKTKSNRNRVGPNWAERAGR